MKKHYGSKGFGAVELLLVILVLAMLGAAAWYIFTKNHNPSTSTSASTSQSSTAGMDSQKPQQDDRTVTLPSMGIKFTPSADLGKVLFKEGDIDQNIKIAVFSNEELTKLKDADGKNVCNSDGSAADPPVHLGILFKVDGTYPDHPTDGNAAGVLVKQFNGYNLQFRVPQQSCFQDEQNQARATALSQELIDSMKNTVQEIQ